MFLTLQKLTIYFYKIVLFSGISIAVSVFNKSREREVIFLK